MDTYANHINYDRSRTRNRLIIEHSMLAETGLVRIWLPPIVGFFFGNRHPHVTVGGCLKKYTSTVVARTSVKLLLVRFLKVRGVGSFVREILQDTNETLTVFSGRF